MIEFEITDLYPGSVAQKNVGIFASFTLNLKTSDGIVVALHDMKLKKRKEQDIWYMESPFSDYTNREGEKRKRHYSRVWPEKENWPKQEPLIKMVRDALADGSATPKAKTQQTQTEPTKTTASPEAW